MLQLPCKSTSVKKYDFFEKSACIFENNLILYTSRVRQAAKTKYMRKCRNWQTSKTKDLVIIAIVWVQVPSSALNNKTGTKQSVWSLSCCSKPKRALNPWFKVSPPARSARGMRSPGPHSPHLPHGFGCCVAGAHGSKVSALLRSAQSRHPRMFYGLRSVSVVAEQTSPGRLATHLLHGYGRGRGGAHGSRSRLCTPSSALKWGKLNYTDFVQNCILDQKERTSL